MSSEELSRMSKKEFEEFFCIECEKIIKGITQDVMGDQVLISDLDNLKRSIDVGVQASFFKIKQIYGEEYKKRMGRDFPDDKATRNKLSQELLLGVLHEAMKAGDFSFLNNANGGK